MPRREHQLSQTANGKYRCEVCQWEWLEPNTARCPGVPRYTLAARPTNLKTLEELAQLGLASAAQYVAVYYDSPAGKFYNLYDVAQVRLVEQSDTLALASQIAYREKKIQKSRRNLENTKKPNPITPAGPVEQVLLPTEGPHQQSPVLPPVITTSITTAVAPKPSLPEKPTRKAYKRAQLSLRGERVALVRIQRILESVPDLLARSLEIRPGTREGEFVLSGWLMTEVEVSTPVPVPATPQPVTDNEVVINSGRKAGNGGAGGRPRATTSKRQKANAAAAKEMPAYDPLLEKPCSQCGKVKQFSEFSRKTLRSGDITYTADCLECRRVRNRKWYSDPTKASEHTNKVAAAQRKKRLKNS